MRNVTDCAPRRDQTSDHNTKRYSHASQTKPNTLTAHVVLAHVAVVIVQTPSLHMLLISHIQRIVLATEETTVTQQVSHRIDLSNANPARGHKQVRRSTGHIMVTTPYSNQQRSKSRQNPCQVQSTENIGNLSTSRRCFWVRTTALLPIHRSHQM